MSSDRVPTPNDQIPSLRKKWVGRLSYLLRNAPLTILAAAMPGFVNYFIILYLTYTTDATATGDYRMIMSWFALAGLVSVQESTKVLIRSATTDSTDVYATIFFVRLVACLTILGVVLAGAIWVSEISHVQSIRGLAPILLLAIAYYPLDIFNSYFQAKRQFTSMSTVACAKYLAALAAFLLALRFGQSVLAATLWQISVMLIFNMVCTGVLMGRDIVDSFRRSLQPWERLTNPAARESIVLSVANMLPGSLEHVDKIVIGAVFGLEALGLYTLGFTTGRFIYNTLKPSLYIYYARFVEKMPTIRLLSFAMVTFTLFGATLAGAFLWGVATFPFLAKFDGARLVTTILFASYGIAMVDAIYVQAYALNKTTNSNHVLTANVLASVACLLLFVIAAQTPVMAAMALFALHYPLRHGATIGILAWLHHQEIRRKVRP